MGGGITIDDSSKVTHRQQHHRGQRHARAPAKDPPIGVPHSAGLASEAQRPGLFQAIARPSRRAPDFSNPVALFNNIFWNNNAFTLDQFGPGATLVNQGFIDFEIARDDEQRGHVHPALLGSDQRADSGPERGAARAPGWPGQQIGANPNFVTPFTLELGGLGVAARPTAGGRDDHGHRPAGRADRRLPHRPAHRLGRAPDSRTRLADHRPRRTLQQYAVRRLQGRGRTTTHVSRAGSKPRTSTTTASRGRRS